MKATQRLHELGQSLWLDNITRVMLMDGTLRRYIAEFSVTGLTSNPTIFDHAIRNGGSYDSAIRQKTAQGKSGEGLFFDLALIWGPTIVSVLLSFTNWTGIGTITEKNITGLTNYDNLFNSYPFFTQRNSYFFFA